MVGGSATDHHVYPSTISWYGIPIGTLLFLNNFINHKIKLQKEKKYIFT